MSTCISRHGEFGSHEPPSYGDDPYCCHRCGAFDEDAVLDALYDAESKIARIKALIAEPLITSRELQQALDGDGSDHNHSPDPECVAPRCPVGPPT